MTNPPISSSDAGKRERPVDASENSVIIGTGSKIRRIDDAHQAFSAGGQPDDGQSDSAIAGLESLESLIRRLGSPPQDLARFLVDQFRSMCATRIQNGQSILPINLRMLYVNAAGCLIDGRSDRPSLADTTFDPAADRNAELDSRVEQFKSLLGAATVREWSDIDFDRPSEPATHLGSPSPVSHSVNDISIESRETPEQSDSDAVRKTLKQQRIKRQTLECDTIHNDDEDRERRDRLVQSFTEALVIRFGEDAVESIPVPAETSYWPVPNWVLPSIKVVQRFNPNHVFFAVTGTAALLMLTTGYVLRSKQRQRLADLAAKPRIGATGEIVKTSLLPTDSKIPAFDGSSVLSSELEIGPLTSDPDDRVGTEIVDDLEQIASSDRVRDPSGRTSPRGRFGDLGEIVSIQIPDAFRFDRHAVLETLSIDESDRNRSGHTVGHEQSLRAALADDGSGVWTGAAPQDVVEAVNGGEFGYARACFQAPPYMLSIDPAGANPTWELKEEITRSTTRLEIDFSNEKGIDLSWTRPFNPTRPEYGVAEAILSSSDDLPVAIYIQVTAECSQKLSCRIRYAARLSPHLAWVPFDSRRLSEHLESINAKREDLTSIQGRLDDASQFASNRVRRKLAEERRKIEQAFSNLDQAEERIDALTRLAAQMETGVGLKAHLYVKRPEGEQSVLRIGIDPARHVGIATEPIQAGIR